MNRYRLLITCIIVIAVIAIAVTVSRPITGTWVCAAPLTEHAMLGDEVTTITIRPDGTADFRSYGDYLYKYEIRHGMGQWKEIGPGKYAIAITQGISVSCKITSNCTESALAPFSISIDHDLIRDTVAYDPAAKPEFSGIRPFVRSDVVRE